MVAKETLEKARYHLRRIEETYDKPEMIYELNSFLSTVASVPEHLLEDYNIKYSLNISDDEKLTREFEDRANRGNNPQAIAFFQWWRNEYDRIKNDKLCSLVIGKRHMSIHRRVARPDLIKVEKILYMTTSVAIEVHDSEGRIKSTYSSPETPRPEATPEKKEAKVTFSFKEYPQDDIVDICRKICGIMEKLVEDASSKFP
jgi:hypothetical protein